MIVERVVMLGSKNIRGDATCSHGHRAHMTGFVRTFHCIFHKGLYLSSCRYGLVAVGS